MFGFYSAMSKIGLRTVGRQAIRRALPSAKGFLRTAPKWAGPAATAFMGYAALQGAGAMKYWAGTNVDQTEQISKDNREQLAYQEDYLDFQRDKWEYEQDAREEDYERSLYQTALIEGFDQNARNFQANLQTQSQEFEAQMYMMKQQQLAQDRNTYLANQAFQTFTGGRQTSKDDQFTIAFILSELQSIYQPKQESNIEDINPYYEPEFDEFDDYNDYQRFA